MPSDDRPPIIVRNGSMTIRSQKPWVNTTGKQWKPDHADGSHISSFHVTVRVADGNAPGPMSGDRVSIGCGTGSGTVTFTFHAKAHGQSGKQEPTLDSPVDLTVDGSRTTLTFEDGGRIESLHVQGSPPRRFDSRDEPVITIQPK